MTPWNWHPHRFRRLFPFALLCALTVALVGFGGHSQAPVPPPEPQSVGPVANLVASAEGQTVGVVRLTWTAAENAQVHFIVYLKSSDLVAGDFSMARMEPFNGTQGVVRGLEPGTSYDFIAIGMRWNWIKYGVVWGRWSEWASATPPSGSAATDRAALIAFYNATDGPNWENYRNRLWLSDAPIGEWHGVTTDPNGRVIRLDPWGENQLTGAIPPELGNLTNLRSLRLSGNQLTGPIPPELGNLISLEELRLGRNQLTGPIPPELGNLISLEELRLSRNQLMGAIPSELGNLTNLEYLDLGGNQLTGAIPPELGNLTNLEYLDLGGNQLTGAIPPELGSLANLRSLRLGGNQLTGAIPPELGSLANLRSLRLGGNQLTGAIPPELGNLISLEELRLSHNQLTGAIPPELGSLTNLEQLNLYGNLTGVIPPELGNLTNLTRLDLTYNQLTGAIPPELGNLTNLTGLHLSGNQFTGCIPAVWRDAAIYFLSLPNLPFCD